MAIVTVLAVIAAMVATILLVPVRIDLDVDTRRASGRLRARVRWLFASWSITRPRRRVTTPKAKEQQRRSRLGFRSMLAAIRTPGFPSRVVRTLAELARLLNPVAARGDIVFGLDDPASTGELLGSLCALRLWPGVAWHDVRLGPHFSGPAFGAVGQAAWVVRPGYLLWPVLSFLGAPVVWRAARAAWSAGG